MESCFCQQAYLLPGRWRCWLRSRKSRWAQQGQIGGTEQSI